MMDVFDIFLFEQQYHDGQCHLEMDGNAVDMFETDDGYLVQIEPPDPEMVCLRKSYDADSLTLKSEGHYLKLGGTQIGVWKDYDPYGDVVEETDYEEGWKTTWDDMLRLLAAEHIDLSHLVEISRYVDDHQSEDEEDNRPEGAEEEEEPAAESDAQEENEEEENEEEEDEEEELMEVEVTPEPDPIDFLKQYFGDRYVDPDELDLPPAHYWIIKEMKDDGSLCVHTFDSDLQRKIWEETQRLER